MKAEGVYFWDAQGKRYLDFASQLVNANIGHQNPRVVKAIQEQAAQLTFVAPGMTTEPRALLGKKLAEITPGDLKKTFFTLGGAEANENAIKIARFYTGRHKILARYRSYHGATHGAMALTGDYRRLPAEPAMPGVVHILDPYCYRCPFGWTRETCHRECIQHVEEIIQHEGPDQIAAIILEGVTGTNGLIIPPDDYWPRMREICDKYGILLISDEVMSGWGRTWPVVDWPIRSSGPRKPSPPCRSGGRGRRPLSDDVLMTWKQLIALHRQAYSITRELKDAEQALGLETTEANYSWLQDVKARMSVVDGTEALIEGFGAASGRTAQTL